MRHTTLVAAVALIGCAQPSVDSPTVQYLQDLSSSTTSYYSDLIRAYGGTDCKYSAPLSQTFWTKTAGDLRVIGARITVVETNQDLRAGLPDLQEAYGAAREQIRLAEADPDRLPGGGISTCLDPEAAMQQSVALTSAVDLMAASAGFGSK